MTPTARQCRQYIQHASRMANNADCSCYSCGQFRTRFASLAILQFAIRNEH